MELSYSCEQSKEKYDFMTKTIPTYIKIMMIQSWTIFHIKPKSNLVEQGYVLKQKFDEVHSALWVVTL